MSIKSKIKSNRIFMGLYDKFLPYYCMFFSKSAVKMLYKQTFQKKLDLKNPRDLNEKINWLKVNTYKNNPLVIQCADKWAVRGYISENGFGEYLNEVFYVYDNVDEINWEDLPEKFALKFNKAAGMNIICSDKSLLNKKETIETVSSWFRAECGERFCELHYRKAPPKVICERYLGDGTLPTDYKIHCFNGRAVFTIICTEREKDLRLLFVDTDYHIMNINTEVHAGGTLPPKPKNYELMISIAESLSKPFPLVRVDFYEICEQLYIGELTFTPQGGYIDYISQEWLDRFGEMLVLPKKKGLFK